MLYKLIIQKKNVFTHILLIITASNVPINANQNQEINQIINQKNSEYNNKNLLFENELNNTSNIYLQLLKNNLIPQDNIKIEYSILQNQNNNIKNEKNISSNTQNKCLKGNKDIYNDKPLKNNENTHNSTINNSVKSNKTSQSSKQVNIISIKSNILNKEKETVPHFKLKANNTIDWEEQNRKNTLAINYMINELWNNYDVFKIPNDCSEVRIISVDNNILQNYINNVNKSHNKLLFKRLAFKKSKYKHNELRETTIQDIKKMSNSNSKKSTLSKFMKEEISKFANDIEYIAELKNRHEVINERRAIIDTYLKLQSILSSNNKFTTVLSNTEKDINNSLNPFDKKISENINSFYESCLIGNDLHVETIDDKLNIINKKTLEIKNNNINSKNMLSNLKLINRKISELEINNNLKSVKNDLRTLNNKISEIAIHNTPKTIGNNLKKLNSTIFKIEKNIQLISNKIHEIKLKKYIIPTNDNMLCWCAENYEDWEEKAEQYESDITNIFKYKLSNGNLNKEEFSNIFYLLNKVAIINFKIENYYRTAKLLCNLSPIKQMYPIILPKSLAV